MVPSDVKLNMKSVSCDSESLRLKPTATFLSVVGIVKETPRTTLVSAACALIFASRKTFTQGGRRGHRRRRQAAAQTTALKTARASHPWCGLNSVNSTGAPTSSEGGSSMHEDSIGCFLHIFQFSDLACQIITSDSIIWCIKVCIKHYSIPCCSTWIVIETTMTG